MNQIAPIVATDRSAEHPVDPLFLHRWFLARSRRDPEGTFRFIQRMHRVLLTISLLTVVAAAAGAHGGLLG